MSKHLIGLVACVATFALGIGIASLFRAPEPPPLPQPAVTARLTQVVFNPQTEKLSATVELRSAEAPPDRVALDLALWTAGSTAGTGAEPEEVDWPAGGARTATVEIATECSGVDVTSSLYANVAVSPGGAFSEKTPVLVAEGARRGR